MPEAGVKMKKKTGQSKKSKSSRKPIGIIALVTFCILIMMSGFAIAYMYAVDFDQRESEESSQIIIDPADRIVVKIPLGSGTARIADILKEEGIISSKFVFKVISSLEGYDGQYKSGNHIVAKNLKYTQVMDILIQNPQAVRVTIPEGYSWIQLVEMLDNLNLINRQTFESIAQNEKFDIKILDHISSNRIPRLEGYLFPDTYDFGSDAKEKDIIERMLLKFYDIFLPEYYEKAEEMGLTVDQVITMASIIEKEAVIKEERSVIAGVFYNRLKGGEGVPNKLESCATVQYILLKNKGTIKKVISIEDTKIDDPYNTYKYEGLPPGPICFPGKASIEAALNPSTHDFYFFVAKGDGSHHFSKTFKEHEAAMKQYGVE